MLKVLDWEFTVEEVLDLARSETDLKWAHDYIRPSSFREYLHAITEDFDLDKLRASGSRAIVLRVLALRVSLKALEAVAGELA